MEKPLDPLHRFVEPVTGIIDDKWWDWLSRLNDVIAWGFFLTGSSAVVPPDGPLADYAIKVYTSYGIKAQPEGLVWDPVTNTLRVNFAQPVPPLANVSPIAQLLFLGNAVSYSLTPYVPMFAVSHPRERDPEGAWITLRFFNHAGEQVFRGFYFNFVIYDLRV